MHTLKKKINQGFLHQNDFWSQPNTPDLKLKINLNHNIFFSPTSCYYLISVIFRFAFYLSSSSQIWEQGCFPTDFSPTASTSSTKPFKQGMKQHIQEHQSSSEPHHHGPLLFNAILSLLLPNRVRTKVERQNAVSLPFQNNPPVLCDLLP